MADATVSHRYPPKGLEMHLRSVLTAAALLALTARSEPAEPQGTPKLTATATVTATARARPSATAIDYGLASDNKSITAPIITDADQLRLNLMAVGLVCDGWQVITEGTGGECDGGTMLNTFPTQRLGRVHTDQQ